VSTGQWVFFKNSEGALLRAPLPSAPEVGDGWRGIELPHVHPLDQVDGLIQDAAGKVEAALGLALIAPTLAYVVAQERRREPIRAVVGAGDGPAADEARARAGVPKRGGKGWRRDVGKRLAAWSSHAPKQARASDVADVLASAVPEAVETSRELLHLMGLAIPEEAPPHYLDLHLVARENPPPPPRRGLFRRRR
jgi:hypothetical protein